MAASGPTIMYKLNYFLLPSKPLGRREEGFHGGPDGLNSWNLEASGIRIQFIIADEGDQSARKMRLLSRFLRRQVAKTPFAQNAS